MNASDLPRLLAHLATIPPPEGRPAFAERLGQWLGWTGDIALSSALAAPLPVPPRAASRQGAEADALDPADDLAQIRAWLESTLPPRPRDLDEDPSDFETHRRHCLARQHAMADAIDALRSRLRAALTQRSPALARLAAVDEVMAHSLAPHERRLLALVPLRLQTHFERLQREAGASMASESGPRWDSDWIHAFRDDMLCVMRAELAHRLLPCQGLVDALRPPAGTAPGAAAATAALS